MFLIGTARTLRMTHFNLNKQENGKYCHAYVAHGQAVQVQDIIQMEKLFSFNYSHYHKSSRHVFGQFIRIFGHLI